MVIPPMSGTIWGVGIEDVEHMVGWMDGWMCHPHGVTTRYAPRVDCQNSGCLCLAISLQSQGSVHTPPNRTKYFHSYPSQVVHSTPISGQNPSNTNLLVNPQSSPTLFFSFQTTTTYHPPLPSSFCTSPVREVPIIRIPLFQSPLCVGENKCLRGTSVVVIKAYVRP